VPHLQRLLLLLLQRLLLLLLQRLLLLLLLPQSLHALCERTASVAASA
jgi:hypothetical protein